MIFEDTLHSNTIVTYWKRKLLQAQAVLAVVYSRRLVAFARSSTYILTANS
jgi:hypothetical protein